MNWAHEPSKLYFVLTLCPKITFGRVFIKFVKPAIESWTVGLNGTLGVVKPGETINISQLDSFKLIDLATNIKNKDTAIRYDFEATAQSDLQRTYRLVFYRGETRLESFSIFSQSIAA